MSMKDFIQTLSEEQKAALLDALSDKDSTASNLVPEEVNEETKTYITDDFRVNKGSNLQSNGRRQAVRAGTNTWTDDGEDRHIETPDVKPTPRNRAKPKMKEVGCHICGKKEIVNASVVFGEFYRCSRCAGK